jgi:hypothetical protein
MRCMDKRDGTPSQVSLLNLNDFEKGSETNAEH